MILAVKVAFSNGRTTPPILAGEEFSVFRSDILKGQTAFCSGASSGINLAIARVFAAHGASLFIISRDELKVEAAVASIGADRAGGCSADVRDFEQVSQAIAKARDRFGPIDILLSGAAGNFLVSAAEMTPKAFRTVIDIDLIGGFNVMKAAYPALRRPGASIISLSALQAFVAMPLQAHASAAKAGLDALVKSLALEWGAEGIRVNSIAPGPVSDTEGMRRLAPTVEAVASLTAMTPLRRWASQEDVANLALFLASPLAANITGEVIVTDGGYSIGKSYL